MSDRKICYVGWAQQPDIQFCCDSTWSSPKWGTRKDQVAAPEVYVADNDRLYTFNTSKVTCEACLTEVKK